MSCNGTQNLCTVISAIIGYLNDILLLLMAVAVVMFVWYVIKYYVKADADKKEAGGYLMYSLIGFFVILSVWGLVAILSNSFGLQNSSSAAPTWQSIQNLFPK